MFNLSHDLVLGIVSNHSIKKLKFLYLLIYDSGFVLFFLKNKEKKKKKKESIKKQKVSSCLLICMCK